MIEPQQLRIGNYLAEFEGDYNPGSPGVNKVAAIGEYLLDGQEYGVMLENGDIYALDSIYPIPLTEQWLEAFGCHEEEEGFGENFWISGGFYSEGDIQVVYSSQDCWMVKFEHKHATVPICQVGAVHSFQNLFIVSQAKNSS